MNRSRICLMSVLMLVIISCSEQSGGLNSDDLNNKSNEDSLLNLNLNNPINPDTLIKMHTDSLLFMNYWSGMSLEEFTLISNHNLENKSIVKIDYINEPRYYVPMYFNEIEYLFQIEYKNPNNVMSNSAFNNDNGLCPPNGYLILTAHHCEQLSTSKSYSIQDGDTIWDNTVTYDLGSNNLVYKTYYEIDKTFNDKYSNCEKIKFEIDAGDFNTFSEAREYRIDGNKCISFRSLPFPDPDFEEVFWSQNKDEPIPNPERVKELKKKIDKLLSSSKKNVGIDPQPGQDIVYYDKNWKIIKPTKKFVVIYLSKTSFDYLLNEQKINAQKNNLELNNQEKAIENKEEQTIQKI